MDMRETEQSPFWRSVAGLAAIGFGLGKGHNCFARPFV
jgi:hypothetical protein